MTSSPLENLRNARGRTLSNACMAALAIAGVSAGAASASAQAVDCTQLPNAIFGIGGSAGTPLIAKIAAHLAGATPAINVVYQDPGACSAMSALIPSATAPVTPLTGAAKYWTPDGKQQTCNFPTDKTTTATWGAMAQEATTCGGVDALPGDVSDNIGPISGFSLIVPNASSENAISAEAVFYIYGLGVGSGGDVSPWNVAGAIGTRKTTSAAGILLAKAVGIPTTRPLAGAKDVSTNQGAVDFITTGSPAAVTTPSAALAFCATETADNARDKVRTLAFKAQGQDCAYGPDSTQQSFDKKNLREGRYFLWNPHHFFAKVDAASHQIADANVAKFIDIVTSKSELPTSTATDNTPTFLNLQIKNYNVPQCAMHVTRSGDMGPLASFQPDKSCDCYFETKATGTKPDSCKACTTDTDCPASASHCNFGYCEVK